MLKENESINLTWSADDIRALDIPYKTSFLSF